MRNDGTPVLIDFGAARQTLSAEGMKLHADVHAGLRLAGAVPKRELLGPWSDIYSVGATMYRLPRRRGAAGGRPARGEGPLRARRRKSSAGKYSDQLLDTIDWCLQLDHLKRPQSVFALQKVLLREKDPEGPSRRSFETNLRGALGRLARR